MRDPRVEALARSSCATRPRCKQGDICVMQGTTVAEPLVQAVYEEVLRAGGLPILQMTPERRAPPLSSSSRTNEQLDWVPPTSEWTAENCDVRIAIMAEVNTRELSNRPEEAGARPEGAQGADGDVDAPRRGRRVPLGADAVPDSRPRRRGGPLPARVRRLLLRRLPGHRRRAGDRLGAPVERGTPPVGVDLRARTRSTSQAPGTDIKLERGRAHLDPLRRRAQHARRRVLHRAGRGLGGGRDRVLVPGHLRRPRGVRA